MTLEDYVRALGFTSALNEDGSTSWTSPEEDERVRGGGDDSGPLSFLEGDYADYYRFDAQGRPIYGSSVLRPLSRTSNRYVADQNGRGRYQLGSSELTDQLRAIGATDADLTYDDRYGYTIPMEMQERWSNAFQQPSMLDNLASNGPMILGGLMGGAIAGGAFGGEPLWGNGGGLFESGWGGEGADIGFGDAVGGGGVDFANSASQLQNPFSGPGMMDGLTTGVNDGFTGLAQSLNTPAGYTGAMLGTALPGQAVASGGASSLVDLLSKLPTSAWTNLLGSGIQGLSSLLGSRAQVAAGDRAAQTLLAINAQNRADTQPYRDAAMPALSNLSDMVRPGSQFTALQADPGYQWRMDQGQKALDNRLRAGGKFYSGSALKAGQDYAQGFASNEFGNVFNRNAALAGIGQTATNNTTNLNANTGNNLANIEQGLGNVRGSGYVGVGNAIQGGLNAYNQDQYRNSLLSLLPQLLGSR